MEDSNSAMTFANFARSCKHEHHLRGQFFKESPGGVCVILVLRKFSDIFLVMQVLYNASGQLYSAPMMKPCVY